MIACRECGEMLTNLRPKGDGIAGICPTHGRSVDGVIMRREDCRLKDGPLSRAEIYAAALMEILLYEGQKGLGYEAAQRIAKQALDRAGKIDG